LKDIVILNAEHYPYMELRRESLPVQFSVHSVTQPCTNKTVLPGTKRLFLQRNFHGVAKKHITSSLEAAGNVRRPRALLE
jgi:hypothetical protein